MIYILNIKNRFISKVLSGLTLYSFAGLIPTVAMMNNSVSLVEICNEFYKNFKCRNMKIRCLDLATGIESEMTYFELICGIVAAESLASFEPEALKAQAVAASTYFIKRGGLNAVMRVNAKKGGIIEHLCYKSLEERKQNWGDKFQYYEDRIENAVRSVLDKVITYDGKPIVAYFFSCCYNHTVPGEIGLGDKKPYLIQVESREFGNIDRLKPVAQNFEKSKVEEILLGKFTNDLKMKFKLNQISPEKWFNICEKLDNGYVCNVEVLGNKIEGVKFRFLFGLRSSNFKIKYNKAERKFEFTTFGYGHGVGMSQFGSQQMALEGKNYEQILKHYYPGTELKSMAELGIYSSK